MVVNVTRGIPVRDRIWERMAFVLHDMFAVPSEDIAPLVDPSPAGPDGGQAVVTGSG